MYVFVYVCMCICMYVCMYVCIAEVGAAEAKLNITVIRYVFVYVCMYVCMYLCMYVYIYTVKWDKSVSKRVKPHLRFGCQRSNRIYGLAVVCSTVIRYVYTL